MATTVVINGITYDAVPRVRLPRPNGNYRLFWDTSSDTATAADLAQGKTAHTAEGLIVGTAEQTDLDSLFSRETSDATLTLNLSGTIGKIPNVQDLTLPNVTEIYDYAGYHSENLKVVDAPNLKRVGQYGFAYTKLNSLNAPALIAVGSYGLSNCDFTSLNLPFVKGQYESGESTLFNAFSYNSKLVSASLAVYKGQQASGYSIGYEFTNCTALTDVDLPALEGVSTYMFSSCTALTSLNFPACKYIWNAAFNYCQRLHDIYLGGSTVVSLSNTNAFNYTPIAMSGSYKDDTARIHVRAELETAYKSATNWSTFASKIVGDYSD